VKIAGGRLPTGQAGPMRVHQGGGVLPVLNGQTRFAAEVSQADQLARTAIPG
jgi:hypothetical protein